MQKFTIFYFLINSVGMDNQISSATQIKPKNEKFQRVLHLFDNQLFEEV